MPRKRKVMMPRGAIQQKAEWSGSRGSYLTAIPNLTKDTLEEMEVFSIREPFTYARILYDHDRSEYIYEVWEPHLDAREKEFLDMIKDSLNRTLEYEWTRWRRRTRRNTSLKRWTRSSSPVASVSSPLRRTRSSTTSSAISSGTDPWTSSWRTSASKTSPATERASRSSSSTRSTSRSRRTSSSTTTMR